MDLENDSEEFTEGERYKEKSKKKKETERYADRDVLVRNNDTAPKLDTRP